MYSSNSPFTKKLSLEQTFSVEKRIMTYIFVLSECILLQTVTMTKWSCHNFSWNFSSSLCFNFTETWNFEKNTFYCSFECRETTQIGEIHTCDCNSWLKWWAIRLKHTWMSSVFLLVAHTWLKYIQSETMQQLYHTILNKCHTKVWIRGNCVVLKWVFSYGSIFLLFSLTLVWGCGLRKIATPFKYILLISAYQMMDRYSRTSIL